MGLRHLRSRFAWCAGTKLPAAGHASVKERHSFALLKPQGATRKIGNICSLEVACERRDFVELFGGSQWGKGGHQIPFKKVMTPT